jgi:RNA polymerase sigma factor (sigma-70 family)
MSQSHRPTSPSELHHDIAQLLPRLRRFARSVTRHTEDADDLVQVALERALRHSAQWQPGTRLDSWLFRIMKNAWIDEVRARSRRDEVPADEDAEDTRGIDQTPQHIARLSVQAAMARLPEDQRIAVGLVLVEGLPYKEAAQVLDIPIGTLTSRLARGREALQAVLLDSGGGE